MNLIDKPLEYNEKEDLKNMLNGNIARICISDDIEEIISQLGFAVDRISMLAYSRVKEILEQD